MLTFIITLAFAGAIYLTLSTAATIHFTKKYPGTTTTELERLAGRDMKAAVLNFLNKLQK